MMTNNNNLEIYRRRSRDEYEVDNSNNHSAMEYDCDGDSCRIVNYNSGATNSNSRKAIQSSDESSSDESNKYRKNEQKDYERPSHYQDQQQQQQQQQPRHFLVKSDMDLIGANNQAHLVKIAAPIIHSSEYSEDSQTISITLYWDQAPGCSSFAVEYMSTEDQDVWHVATEDLNSLIVRKNLLNPSFAYRFRVRPRILGVWQRWSDPSELVSSPSHNPLISKLFRMPDRSSSLILHQGGILRKADPKYVSGKLVMIYFSASWCQSCVTYTPKLVEFYHKMRDSGKLLEIIFVSVDKKEKDFQSYFATMPWLGVDYSSPARQSCISAFKVNQIPSIKVISSHGTIVETEGTRYQLSERTFDRFYQAAQLQ